MKTMREHGATVIEDADLSAADDVFKINDKSAFHTIARAY